MSSHAAPEDDIPTGPRYTQPPPHLTWQQPPPGPPAAPTWWVPPAVPTLEPEREDEPEPVSRGTSGVTLVVLAAIGAVLVMFFALLITGNAKDATGVATLALLAGVGMAIGFRKQWTR